MPAAHWVPTSIAWIGLVLAILGLASAAIPWFLLRPETPAAGSTENGRTRTWWPFALAAILYSLSGHLVARSKVVPFLTQLMRHGIDHMEAVGRAQMYWGIGLSIIATATAILGIIAARAPSGRRSGNERTLLRGAAWVTAASLAMYLVVYYRPLAGLFLVLEPV